MCLSIFNRLLLVDNKVSKDFFHSLSMEVVIPERRKKQEKVWVFFVFCLFWERETRPSPHYTQGHPRRAQSRDLFLFWKAHVHTFNTGSQLTISACFGRRIWWSCFEGDWNKVFWINPQFLLPFCEVSSILRVSNI